MTDETKKFSSTVLLSVATGLALPDVKFDRMHEAIERLLGESVWTHQLASPEPWAKAREALVAQHPVFASVDASDLKASLEGKSDSDRWRLCSEWMNKQMDEVLGARGFAIAEGHGRAPEDVQDEAFRSLAALGKPTVVLEVVPR